MEDGNFFLGFYQSENGGGVNATPVVVTFEGQKVFAIVFLQRVRAAGRGSNAQLSRNVLPGFLFCALWVKQEQTCVEKKTKSNLVIEDGKYQMGMVPFFLVCPQLWS